MILVLVEVVENIKNVAGKTYEFSFTIIPNTGSF